MKFDFNLKNTIIISVAIFVLLLVIGYLFLKPSGRFETYVMEDSFNPVVEVKLLASENYVYKYTVGNVSLEVDYLVGDILDKCADVSGVASINKSIRVSTCFDIRSGQPGKITLTNEYGIKRQIDPENFSFLKSWMFFDFFQPWMLGAKENFVWNSSRVIEQKELRIKTIFKKTYKVESLEKRNGRDTYRVELYSTEIYNDIERSSVYDGTMWIDKEKRVLVYYNSPESRIELIKAPFSLK